ncbi:MAG: tripartite tricarboxylate transporter permease [Candidatus Pacearchaeota archaeon]
MLNFVSQIIAGLLLGILAGTFTGLVPGIHVNTLAFFIVSSFTYLSKYFQPLPLASFIVSMSITHTFIDFIPSIFLGLPDEDTTLSILPGHSLLLEGKGYNAVLYTLYGSLIGLFVILILSPIFVFFLPKFYFFIKKFMFFVLFFVSIYLLIREENKVLAFIVFTLSGLVGISSFSLPLKEYLMPMLTGLFGSSSLIISLMKKQKIPKQKIHKFKISLNKKRLFKIISVTSLASSLCSFLPALGSGQAAVISSDITKEQNKPEFLMLIGSINTIVMGLSIISLYSINVQRTGSAAAISQILPEFSISHLFILILIITFSGLISFFVGLNLSKFFSCNIEKINYKKLSFCVLIFISLVVLFFAGSLGFLLFLVSTFLGLFTILSGARRTLMMGCLMLPALLWYFPF